MKTHTKTPRPQFLLGLLAAGIVLASAATLSTRSGQYSAAVLNSSNSTVGLFDPPRTEPGCTQWLVYQKMGPVMTFWNANGSVARTVSGTTMTSDLKLSVPAGKFIKYVAYGSAGNHAMNVYLSNANNVGVWYSFSSAKNGTPYRFENVVQGKGGVNLSFKKGHVFQETSVLAVTYCPLQMSSSSSSAPNTSFTISINGPATQTYSSGDQDVVMANVTMNAGTSDVTLKDLFIAVQGTKYAYGNLGGVELRSKITGRTIPGIIPDTTSSTWRGQSTTVTPPYYTIYRFDDVPVRGQDTYEFRVDMGNALVNDSFRIHICGEPLYVLDRGSVVFNINGCDFGGLVPKSTVYQMDIVETANNSRVADVRPRGIISGNFQNVLSPILTISSRPMAVTDVAVSNAKNISLFRFEAMASNVKDLLFTGIHFQTAGVPSGNADLRNGTNYTLWVDTNRDGTVDTVLQSGVNVTRFSDLQYVDFDSLQNGGYVIPKNQSVTFEVHADVASSIMSAPRNQLKMQFDTDTAFIKAETADSGVSLTGIACMYPNGQHLTSNGCIGDVQNAQISVLLTDTGTAYTLKNQGDLYVAQSSSPILPHHILGGTVGDSVLRLQFHAEYEDIDVTDLVLTSYNTSASDFQKNIDSLQLYKVGATTPFAVATIGGCSGTIGVSPNAMCANMDAKELVVAKGADQDILVRPKAKTDEQGSVSGSSFGLLVDPTPTAWSGSGSVRARGAQSSNTLLKNDGDTLAEGEVFIGTNTAKTNIAIQGPNNQIVHSTLSSIINVNPDPNGTAVTAGASKPIGKFRFTAAQNSNTKNGVNKVVLNRLRFIVSSQNVLLSTNNVFLRNPVGNDIQSPCVVADGTQQNGTVTGNFYVFCDNINALTAGSIGPGEYMNLYLTMDVLNQKITAAASSLQVGMYVHTNQAPYPSLQWTDKDNVSSQSFGWVDYPEGIVYSTLYQN